MTEGIRDDSAHISYLRGQDFSDKAAHDRVDSTEWVEKTRRGQNRVH